MIKYDQVNQAQISIDIDKKITKGRCESPWLSLGKWPECYELFGIVEAMTLQNFARDHCCLPRDIAGLWTTAGCWMEGLRSTGRAMAEVCQSSHWKVCKHVRISQPVWLFVAVQPLLFDWCSFAGFQQARAIASRSGWGRCKHGQLQHGFDEKWLSGRPIGIGKKRLCTESWLFPECCGHSRHFLIACDFIWEWLIMHTAIYI